MSPRFEVRDARIDDADAVAAIGAESWPDREGLEYLPQVFESWLEKEHARTLVAEVTDADAVPDDAPAVAGIAQVVLLSEEEAWAQGMRVHPAYRGEGVGSRIVETGFDWAREQGATVARNMVFSWNSAGLGQSRATGFEPATELRFASPEPAAGADPSDHGPADAEGVVDPAAAWRYWTHSDARQQLSGLAADDEERWAVRELTREDLDRVAEDDGAIAIRTGEGIVAMAVRSRIDRRSGDEDDHEDQEGEGDDATGTTAVYGAAAWDDQDACAALLSAIAADAAAVGADDTRLLLPETARHVSDVAACRAEIGDEPDFVLAADLTAQ
ncbi:GNAT family N-acetyltransferase [Salinarchaeum chitinilyticum]